MRMQRNSDRKSSRSSLQPAQLGDATGGNPLGDKNISVGIEAGVMGVDKFTVDPFATVIMHVLDLLGDTFDIRAQARHDFVLSIENAHPSM